MCENVLLLAIKNEISVQIAFLWPSGRNQSPDMHPQPRTCMVYRYHSVFVFLHSLAPTTRTIIHNPKKRSWKFDVRFPPHPRLPITNFLICFFYRFRSIWYPSETVFIWSGDQNFLKASRKMAVHFCSFVNCVAVEHKPDMKRLIRVNFIKILSAEAPITEM